jgi:hypothetical protein
VKKKKERKFSRLFSKTGGFSKFRNQGKGEGEYDQSFEKDDSLSQIFNEYDI